MDLLYRSILGAKRMKVVDSKTSDTAKSTNTAVSKKATIEKPVASKLPVKGPAGDNAGPCLTGKNLTLHWYHM